MLTKEELDQLRTVLREEIEVEHDNTRSELLAELKLFRMEITDRLEKVESRLKNAEIILKKVTRDLSTAINLFDRTDIKLQKRVEKIEEHLNLPSN